MVAICARYARPFAHILQERGEDNFSRPFLWRFPKVETKLVTAEELAQRLEVKPCTIRKWSRQGKIPAVRISPKVVRFDAQAVMAILSKGGAK